MHSALHCRVIVHYTARCSLQSLAPQQRHAVVCNVCILCAVFIVYFENCTHRRDAVAVHILCTELGGGPVVPARFAELFFC